MDWAKNGEKRKEQEKERGERRNLVSASGSYL